MKWMQTYMIGYAIVLAALVAALWKLGVIERIGSEWTAIGVAVAVGVGIMVSVASSGKKESVEIDRKG
jgi:hypothetical protein